jgi:hypothetical protein
MRLPRLVGLTGLSILETHQSRGALGNSRFCNGYSAAVYRVWISSLLETLITDLHPSGEGPECAQFFDSTADGLSRCRETPVFGVTASAPRQIQFSR